MVSSQISVICRFLVFPSSFFTSPSVFYSLARKYKYFGPISTSAFSALAEEVFCSDLSFEASNQYIGQRRNNNIHHLRGWPYQSSGLSPWLRLFHYQSCARKIVGATKGYCLDSCLWLDSE
jgi:hypothetical protein